MKLTRVGARDWLCTGLVVVVVLLQLLLHGVAGEAARISEGIERAIGRTTETVAVTIPREAEARDLGALVAKNFGSFSVEFSSFVDYFGNETNPNVFTRNLLQNLGDLTGGAPIIRVGGSTQDRAVFSPNLTIPINNTFAVPPGDQPISTIIGPTFFSSFLSQPANITFIPGLNFALNTTAGRISLLEEAQRSCLALKQKDNLYLWELGNEDDLAPGSHRPANFTVEEYTKQWVDRERAIAAVVSKAGCNTSFWAPSFARVPGRSPQAVNFSAETAFEDGLNIDRRIREVSMHNLADHEQWGDV